MDELAIKLLVAHGDLAQKLFIKKIEQGDAPYVAARKSIEAASIFLDELTKMNQKFQELSKAMDKIDLTNFKDFKA